MFNVQCIYFFMVYISHPISFFLCTCGYIHKLTHRNLEIYHILLISFNWVHNNFMHNRTQSSIGFLFVFHYSTVIITRLVFQFAFLFIFFYRPTPSFAHTIHNLFNENELTFISNTQTYAHTQSFRSNYPLIIK